MEIILSPFFWICLILSFVGLWIYSKVAVKLGIVDIPNERSSHNQVTLRGGGLVLILMAVYNLVITPDQQTMLLAGSLLIGIVTGFLDDRYGLPTLIRFGLYLLAAGILLLGVLQLHHFDTLIWFPLFIVMLGAVNTYNFMDGINGITALYSLVFIITTLFLLSDLKLSNYMNVLLGFGAFFLAFLYFNYRKKAMLFLGDSGSVSMGLLAAFFVVYLGVKLETWTPIILLGVYGVDSVGTIIIRLIKRENILQAHKSHLYQDIVHIIGLSHLKVSWIYASLQLIVNVIFVVSLSQNQHNITVLILLILLASVFVLLKRRIYGNKLFVKLAN